MSASLSSSPGTGKLARIGLALRFAVVLALASFIDGPGASAQMMSSPMSPAQMQSRQALISWTEGTELKAHPSEPKPQFNDNLRALGAAWYGDVCATCHGPQGDGNGPRAAQLSPVPRDFTKGVYEFRSTPTGALPTDEDIWKVVSNGLHGTAMVPWIALSENDRWALVAYIESFSPRFAREARPASINLTAPPAETPQLVAQGRKIFADAGCTDCHGARGHGDGPSSSSLTDAGGRPIRPLDFGSGIFRRGSNLDDIFLTVRTGLDGTPMPSYADSLTADQTWAIAAYVRSLIASPSQDGGATSLEIATAARGQEHTGMMLDMPGMRRKPRSHDIGAPLK
jgi:mono/diheme cytochrome c family protein